MVDPLQTLIEFLVTATTPASTTLTADASASALALSITSGTGWTSGKPIIAKCGSELLRAVRSNVTLSVTTAGRGIMGTTAAVHASGAAIYEAALYQVCGTRVSIRPPGDNAAPSLWLQASNITTAVESQLISCDVLVRCFGGSINEIDAFTVFRLLYDRLYHATHSGTYGAIQWALFDGGGEIMRDPDTDWLFVPARFSVTVR